MGLLFKVRNDLRNSRYRAHLQTHAHSFGRSEGESKVPAVLFLAFHGKEPTRLLHLTYGTNFLSLVLCVLEVTQAARVQSSSSA
jgi:hypothetical protein